MPKKKPLKRKRASRAAKPPPPPPNPLALTTPASLGTVLSMTLGAGIDHAFILLGHMPREAQDPRLDKLLLDYRQATPETRPKEDELDQWIVERGVPTWEFLGWVVMAIGALGGNASQLIINSAKLPLVKASLERSLTDPEERKLWMQGWGHFPVPSKSTVIVNASASAQSIAAASAEERGLPTFVDTTEEAEEALRQLPESSAETIDVPLKVVEGEKVHANLRS